MATPATGKITATFGRKYVSAFAYARQFEAALKTIEAGLQSGKIWNQEFQDAKSWVAHGCEHAQHVAAGDARKGGRSYGDARDSIGYAFQMNQAAKASRELKKLAKRIPGVLNPGTAEYIMTLDQIDGVWKWLQSVKPVIVKGRKPSAEKTPGQIAEEMANTGRCCICEGRQKLSQGGEPRSRTLVHHGYKMSEYNHSGNRMGACFGAFKPPYEVSCEPNREYRALLQGDLRDAKSYLADLTASKMDELDVTEYPKGLRQPALVPCKRGTDKYERERESRIWRTKSRIRQLTDEIAHQKARIDSWKPAPLYEEKSR